MREIKFRAWDGREVKNVLWVSLNHNELMFQNGINGYYEGRLKNCDLMQYTGLKDSSGAYIYEGDIISGAVVKMSEYHAEWAGEWKNGDGAPLCEIAHEYSVIGNIYENPELME